MTEDAPSPVSRAVSDAAFDDAVMAFAAEALDVRGRLIRLGPAIDAILRRHDYPEPVARLIAEATALTALMGAALKESGRFQLQTRSDGFVSMAVVDFDAPDRLRAFARFDAERIAQALREGPIDPAQLLGRGHLAFTIDRGGETPKYQGVVPLDGESLEAAAQIYFSQSEQIPTCVRLAVGEEMIGAAPHWRAGGLMVQYLPQSAQSSPTARADSEDSWIEARARAASVQAHELLDPNLSGERLLYRLFHENGLRAFDTQILRDQCGCSAAGVRAMLQGFSPQERAEMAGDDGRIGVTCEFCSTLRSFDPREFEDSTAAQ